MTELPEPTLEELDEEANIRRIAREVAREEIASLAGLVVRRTQETDPDMGPASGVTRRAIASIFGEALNDFTTDTEPGS
jgi:uncharacterized protein (UPF0254 family)